MGLNTENEVWKEPKSFDWCVVSNLGNVKNKRTGNVLKKCDNGNGYHIVRKMIDNVRKNFYVHRLVADAFLDNPHCLPEINHIDGNKHNNNVSNLEWCSHSDNISHSYRIGIRTTTEKQRIVLSNNGKKTWKNLKIGWLKWSDSCDGKAKIAEHQKNITIEAAKKNKRKVGVIKNGVIVERYNSVSEAAKSYSIHPTDVSHICSGKRKWTTTFVYIDEFEGR